MALLPFAAVRRDARGLWYIRTSDGKTTTFKPGDVLCQVPQRPSSCWFGRVASDGVAGHADAFDARTPNARGETRVSRRRIRTTPRSTHWPNSGAWASPERRAALERRQRRALQPVGSA